MHEFHTFYNHAEWNLPASHCDNIKEIWKRCAVELNSKRICGVWNRITAVVGGGGRDRQMRFCIAHLCEDVCMCYGIGVCVSTGVGMSNGCWFVICMSVCQTGASVTCGCWYGRQVPMCQTGAGVQNGCWCVRRVLVCQTGASVPNGCWRVRRVLLCQTGCVVSGRCWFVRRVMVCQKVLVCQICVDVSDECVYAVGGFDSSNYQCSVERLDPREGKWSFAPAMLSRR